MKTYQVRAKRWERGWELHIDGVGVTQTRSLARAERDVADYLDMMVGEETREVVVTPELGASISAEVRAARDAVARLAEQQRAAAEKSRAAVRLLEHAGLGGAEIAAVLKVSPQRVSQLVAEGRSASGNSQKPAPKSGAKAGAAKRARSVAAGHAGSTTNTKTTSAAKRKSPATTMAAKASSTPSAGTRRRRQP